MLLQDYKYREKLINQYSGFVWHKYLLKWKWKKNWKKVHDLYKHKMCPFQFLFLPSRKSEMFFKRDKYAVNVKWFDQL